MEVSKFLENVYDVVLIPVIGLLFGVAFIYFVYGIIKFIGNQSDDKGREEGKKSIIYGIIGMVIMVSVFGIINIVINTLDIDDRDFPNPSKDIFPDVEEDL